MLILRAFRTQGSIGANCPARAVECKQSSRPTGHASERALPSSIDQCSSITLFPSRSRLVPLSNPIAAHLSVRSTDLNMLTPPLAFLRLADK